MTGRRGEEWEVRIYHFVLRILPAHLSRAHRDDMVDMFRLMLVEAGPTRGARLGLLVRASWDALRHGSAAWTDRWLTADTERRDVPMPRSSIVHDTRRDLRHGLRLLRVRPGFAATVIMTLALGVGASTSIFSVVDGILFRPLAYPEPERLVAVWETYPAWRGRPVLDAFWDRIGLAWPDYMVWKAGQRAFEDVAVYDEGPVTLFDGGEAERLDGVAVSASLLDVLAVRPAQGRFFLPGEDGPGGPDVAVISHGLWLRRFGGDLRIAGRAVQIEGKPFTVIGVLPPGFRLAFASGDPEVWTPIGSMGEPLSESNHTYTGIARLHENVPRSEALAETEQLLRGERPPQRLGARLVPLRESIVSAARPPLLLLLGAAGVLLMISCINVATMLLSEARARAREVAIRAALGATPLRIVRQFLVESLMLSSLAAAAGAGLAVFGTRALVALAPPDLPRLDEIAVDGRVLLFVVGLALFTGVTCGLAPAVSLARRRAFAALRSGSRETSRRGGRHPVLLLGAELAVVSMLLIVAALLGRSLLRVDAVDPGFRSERLLTTVIDLPSRDYPSVASVAAFYEGLLPRLRAIAGVELASGISVAPYTGLRSSNSVGLEGLPESAAKPEVEGRTVLPDYFQTMQIPLLAGRAFGTGRREMIVSESMARRLWPGTGAVGQRASLRDDWYTVIGVVGDVRDGGARSEVDPTFYVSVAGAREPQGRMRLILRTTGSAAPVAPEVRRVIREWKASIPATEMITMDALERRMLAAERYRTVLVTAYACLAVLLAGAGVFGVTTQVVRRQWREIGVRLALGASPRGVLLGILGRTGMAAAIGLAAGGLAAMALQPLVATFLYGVSGLDPWSHFAAAAALVLSALAASWLPARRAARLDPASVLRSE